MNTPANTTIAQQTAASNLAANTANKPVPVVDAAVPATDLPPVRAPHSVSGGQTAQQKQASAQASEQAAQQAKNKANLLAEEEEEDQVEEGDLAAEDAPQDAVSAEGPAAEEWVLAQANTSEATAEGEAAAATDGGVVDGTDLIAEPVAVAAGASFGPVLFGAASIALVAHTGSGGAAAPAAQPNTVNGQIVLGPVLPGSGLEVDIWGVVNGAWTKVGTATVDDNGTFTADLGSYTGPIVAKLVDGNGDDVDFMNEDGVKTDVAVQLMATGYVDGDGITLNISYETTIAAKVAGIPSDGNLDAVTLTQATITEANTKTAAALGLTGDITQQNTVPVINADGTSNIDEATPSGKVAATLSALLQTSTDQTDALATLAQQIKTTGTLGDQLGTFVEAAKLAQEQAADDTLVDTVTANLSLRTATSADLTINAIDGDTKDGVIKAAEKSVTLSGKAPAGATSVMVQINDDSAVEATIDATAGTWTLAAADYTDLDDGGHTVTVTATLADGTSTVSSTRGFVVDAVNDAPTKVFFANSQIASTSTNVVELTSDTPVVEDGGRKVADIVVVDADGANGGTYTTAVSDTTNFEIKTNATTGKLELWLKAGTVLNHEATASYSTTVTVDGKRSGNYTVNVTNVNEAPTLTQAGNDLTEQQAVKDQSSWSLSLATVFTDVDSGDTLSYSIVSGTLPAGLTLTNGMLGGTPTAVTASPVTVTVKATDASGASVTKDVLLSVVAAPTVTGFSVTDTVTSNGAALGKAGEAMAFAVTFSEPVTTTAGLTAVFMVNGQEVTATAAAVSSATNTITFTGTVPATGDGAAITLKSLAVDGGGSLTGSTTKQPLVAPTENAIAQSTTYTVDNTAPTITAVTDATTASVTNGDIEFTVTFSEAVVGTVGTGNFNATNGTVSTVTAVEGSGNTTFKVTVTPTTGVASGSVALSLVGTGLTDAAGNAVQNADLSIVGGVSTAQAIDTLSPTVDVTDSVSATTAGIGNITYTFAFSETVTGFDASKITAVGGQVVANTFTTSDGGKTYTVAITPTAGQQAGTLKVTTNTNGVTDAAGNPATAPSTTADQAYDTKVPTLEVTRSNTGVISGDTTFTFTFSEVMTGFALEDIKLYKGTSITAIDLTGLTLNATTSGKVFTLTVPKSAIADFEGTLKLVVDNTQADLAGNEPVALPNFEFTTDTLAPTVTIAPIANAKDGSYSNGFTVNAGATVTVTVGGNALDATALDAKFSKTTSGSLDTYTAKLDSFVGTEEITVDATLADEHGNEGTAIQKTLKIDREVEVTTVTTGGIAPNADLVVNFDEDVELGSGTLRVYKASDNTLVKTFTVDDPEVTLSADQRTVTINPADDWVAGTAYYVLVDEGVVVDTLGNPITELDVSSGDDAWTFTAGALSTTVSWAGVGDDDVLNNAEKAELTLSGVLSNSGGATDVAIASIVFTPTDDSTAVTLSTGLPTLTSSTNGATWTLDNGDWVNSLASGKTYTVTVNLTGNFSTTPVTGSGTAAGTLAVDTVAPTVTSSYNVDENTLTDTTLRTITLTGTDASAPLTWSNLGGADADKFTLSGNTLTFKGVTNFEAPDDVGSDGIYTITVDATDAAGNTKTGQTVSINLQNVNEAPTVATPIADATTQFVVGQTGTYTFALDTFTDVDAGTSLAYTATLSDGSALPTWLSFDADERTFTGTATGDAPITVKVTASDGRQSVSDEFVIDPVVAPALSTALTSAVTNLDVRSSIVFTVGESVTANEGGTITLRDLGGTGFRGDTNINNQVIDVTDTTQVQIVGTGANTKIIVTPKHHLDLASNYALEISTGAFRGETSQQDSVAFSTINFGTVNPGLISGTSLAAAAESQIMNNDGSLSIGLSWIEGAFGDLNSDPKEVDAGVGNYVFVVKDYDSNPLDDVYMMDDGNLKILNFGADDLFYIDNQNNQETHAAMQAQMIGNMFTSGDGSAQFPIYMPFNDNGKGSLGYDINLVVAPEVVLPDYGDDPILNVLNSNNWNNHGVAITG